MFYQRLGMMGVVGLLSTGIAMAAPSTVVTQQAIQNLDNHLQQQIQQVQNAIPQQMKKVQATDNNNIKQLRTDTNKQFQNIQAQLEKLQAQVNSINTRASK